MYGDKFRDWHKKGYTGIVTDENPRAHGNFYYTHFPVVKMDRETTKCRPVLDGAAKFGGVSMNDGMYQGPMYMNDMADVLMRLRLRGQALMGDIEEMFLQVAIPEEDRPLNRFVWCEDGLLIIYESNVHMFGKNNSPCAASFGSQSKQR
jgi:hypothetical protein